MGKTRTRGASAETHFVPFPSPEIYTSEAADIARDEAKRTESPPSFFFSRAWGLVLAASYFTDARLAGGYSAVAAKHRQRIQSASFGQVMASFEWCVKDYIAQLIDATDLLDVQIEACKWIVLEKSRVLAQREATASIGAILIHPTLGWNEAGNLHARYSELFHQSPLHGSDTEMLDRLWLLRHSVAHNAGFVTNHDAYRMRAPSLSEKSVRMDPEFLQATWAFLGNIVRRLGDPVGTRIVHRWLQEKAVGDFHEDQLAYAKLKRITSVVESRSVALPTVTSAQYAADCAAALP